MNGILLKNSEEISDQLKKIKLKKIAVAYIGKDYKNYIENALDNLETIIVSQSNGNNPIAIKELIERENNDKTGKFKIYFLKNLHSKIYIGDDGVIIASANLSYNGLSNENNSLIEIGYLINNKDEMILINNIFKEYEIKSEKNIEVKQIILQKIEKYYKEFHGKEIQFNNQFDEEINKINSKNEIKSFEGHTKSQIIEQLELEISKNNQNVEYQNDEYSYILDEKKFKIHFINSESLILKRNLSNDNLGEIAFDINIEPDFKFDFAKYLNDYFAINSEEKNDYINKLVLLVKVTQSEKVSKKNKLWLLYVHDILSNMVDNNGIDAEESNCVAVEWNCKKVPKIFDVNDHEFLNYFKNAMEEGEIYTYVTADDEIKPSILNIIKEYCKLKRAEIS